MLTAEMTKINILIAKKKYGSAVKLLRRILKDRPDDVLLLKQLGSLLPLAGKPEEGMKILYGIAHNFARRGFFTKAIAILKKMQRLFPEKNNEIEKAIALLTERDRAAASPPVETAAPSVSSASPSSVSSSGEIEMSDDDSLEFVHLGHDDTPSNEPDTLLDSPLFKGIAKDKLGSLISGLVLREYEPGEILFSEDAPGHSLMVLVSGRLRVYVRSAAKTNEQVRILEEGAFFGEISLLSGKPRTATITCADKAEILELDVKTLKKIAVIHPEIPGILQQFYLKRAGSEEERNARKT